MPVEICKELAWDSEFFGLRIARFTGDELTRESAVAAQEFCRDRHVDCLYLLLADGGVATANGFAHVDTRLTLYTPDVARGVPLPDGRGSRGIAVVEPRNCSPSDISALRDIARVSHRDSRFYSDPNFDRARCNALYETWIERSCEGWADRCFVADFDGRPSGYITCHLSNSGVGSIGLFAVAETARGRGLGKALVAGALAYFRESGMRAAEVVTQLRNEAAQQIYQRCGFVPSSQQMWFHAWFNGKAGNGRV